MAITYIEWTDRTWNPVTGCTKISPGCKNCYAEPIALRLQTIKNSGYEKGFEINCHEKRLNHPLKRRTPTMFFVNSMSDLFHEKVPFKFVDKIMETIKKTPQHTYQILTKRPSRMAEYFLKRDEIIPYHVWLGVSVENKKHGIPRIEILKSIPGRTRFLSIEPLLEDIGEINLRGIHWVIVGGESGTKARPMNAEWVLNIQKQCKEQNTPFFFKQWGTWGNDGLKRSKRANGRFLKGKEFNQYPRRKTLTPS